MSAGECQTTNRNKYDEEADEKPTAALDEGDIALLKTYGVGPYTAAIKAVEDDIKKHLEKVKELIGIKESDTGLSQPSQWDLVSDKQMMQEEQPLQVARCTKIIAPDKPSDTKYVINIRQIAKFVVGLGEKVSPTDVEEGMRVGVDHTKYAIQMPLPPKIDPTVSLMEVEEKPDVTYDDVGGSKKALGSSVKWLRFLCSTPSDLPPWVSTLPRGYCYTVLLVLVKPCLRVPWPIAQMPPSFV